MLVLTLVFFAILVLAATAHATPRDAGEGGRIARILSGRGVAVGVFVTTFGVLWYAWAAMNPIPVVHDEISYVLQAQIFAQGRWALSSPPIPLFWEQFHVLTEPTLASKYFPGHALVMSLGALVGWLALMPLVLQSGCAVLLFVLARRVAGGGVALLTWVVWLLSPMVLYFGPSYFSESTTTICWLGGWYALLRWRESGNRNWLFMIAALTGYGEVTRPLTGVAYAIPMGITVLWLVYRRRCWKDFLLACVVGTVVLAIIPLWSVYTTGDWTLTPLALYTRSYMPYDVPGFGLLQTPPTHSITPDLHQWNLVYSSAHTNHFVSNLFPTFVSRATYLSVSIWGSSSGVLKVFAVLGLVTLKRESAFAVGTGVFLLLTYLSFGTPAQWTLYYYESVPAYAFLTAAGMAWCASLIGRPRGVPPAPAYEWSAPRWTRALAATALALALGGAVPLQIIHRQHISDRQKLQRFESLVSSIADARAVLFVRYSPLHNPHVSFVRNTADLENERVWVVYDRGEAENARLLALAPERKAYLFDEQAGRTYVYEARRTDR